jgi:hypothetical protein
MNLYTIYERPLDYPSGYVVRMWTVGPGGTIEPSRFADYAPTLDQARACLPDGLYRLEREPGDDPAILETWI